MTRLILGNTELEVSEDFENILQRISHASENGPTVGGMRVLPAGWMIARPSELEEDVYIQTSTISYVRRG
jgi:hypothetical protein